MMTVLTGPNPPVDYTSRDWSAIVQMMLDSAVVLFPEWTNRTSSDFGVVLIELFAYPFDVLNFYVDRVANESFLATATQRTSVLALAAQLNYTPNGSQASTAVLSLTLPGAAVLTIPAGTEFSGGLDSNGDPLIFTSDSDVVVPGSGGPQTITVDVTQGAVVDMELLGTSCGFVNTTYTLADTPVIDGSLTVFVIESLLTGYIAWSPIAHLLDAGPTDNVYSTSLDTFGGITITFGDGINGRIPPNSSVVRASYRTGGGAESNVVPHSIDEIVDPTDLFAASGGTLTSLTGVSVDNPTAATGGADPESTESIRTNAPLQLTALERAITMKDFRALAVRLPGVAKANATAVVYTNVVVYIAPAGGGTPSGPLLTAVEDYFGPDVCLPGVVVTADAPTYVGIDITASVAVAPQYSQASTTNTVNAAINALLSFDNTDFAQRVNLSQVFHQIMAVSGVYYLNITLLARSGGSGAADVVMAANEIPVVGTISLTVTGGTGAGS